jgi:hypothetical protein
MSTSTRPASPAVSLLVLLALAAGGCSDSTDGPGTSAPSSSPSSSAPVPDEVRTKTTLGTVTGRLAKRDRVATVAGEVADRWFDAAYVGGDYPRRAFDDAFPGFTPGARAQALGDRALMSNQDIARRIDAVTASRRMVRVDILAVRGRAVGMTARFVLDLTTTGELRRKVEVRGRLLLTRTDNGWKVFGYDVNKDVARLKGGAR